MKLDDFMRPITIAMETQFLTSTASGRIMKKQESGVILSLTATPGGIGYPKVGGFGPACCAIEGFSREDTMLKKLPMMADIANVATFLASELAGKITGVTIDVTCGTTTGLNYKVPSIPFSHPTDNKK
jgi:3-oxoacyl-[acyl-carrier protein] reductase